MIKIIESLGEAVDNTSSKSVQHFVISIDVEELQNNIVALSTDELAKRLGMDLMQALSA